MGRPAKYPEEFKREAVAWYHSSDRPRCEVAKSLGISDGSLAAWVKQAAKADEPGALSADERAKPSATAPPLPSSTRCCTDPLNLLPRISPGRRTGEPAVRLRAPGPVPHHAALCTGRGPRSSFYEWDTRPLSDHYLDDAALANEIHDIHVASRRTYGAPRVAGQLANRGRRHSRKRVARIMGECGQVGVHGRKKWRRGSANPAPAPDLLGRDFTAERSNQRWVADIIEFRCWDGKLYLAGIVDLHDHGIVGWSMGQRQTTDLVVGALVMALVRRMPDGDLLHHAESPVNTSPSATPNASLEFTNRLAEWGLAASYSRVGCCFDCEDPRAGSGSDLGGFRSSLSRVA